MTRDYAQTNITIWQDGDWRALPFQAQYLYHLLWTHPGLSYCGVADWRPGRLAPFAKGLTVDLINQLADCLEARYFIRRDVDTEEVLLRSWVRFDGLMRKPRMAVSMVKAYAEVSSNTVRGVIVHEARKLKEREPEAAGWKDTRVQELLSMEAINPRDLPVPCDPFAKDLPVGLPSACEAFAANPTSGLRSPTPTPAITPSSNSKADPRKRGSRIPEDFLPTAEMVAWARENLPGFDTKTETANFIDYWKGVAGAKGVKLDWPATWRKWMRTSAAGASRGPVQLVPAYTETPVPDRESLPW